MLYDEEDCVKSSIDNPFQRRESKEKSSGRSERVKPGEVFNYASGTSNILSGLIRQSFDDHGDYLEFPHKELFDPLGMDSALIEIDQAGNYILSSYGWATARDWTRFGLLYLYKGNWFGKEIFNEEWYLKSIAAAKSSKCRYGYHIWLNTTDEVGHKELKNVPDDAFYEDGVFGQRILIIPSKDLVISVFSGMMDGKVFETFFDDFYGEVLDCFKR